MSLRNELPYSRVIELHEIVQKGFLEAIRKKIVAFNETRGRRKELTPNFVESIPRPYRKFGGTLSCRDGVETEILSERIPQIARILVRTLLQRKPRPATIAVAVLKSESRGDYLFRLVLPRIKRNNN